MKMGFKKLNLDKTDSPTGLMGGTAKAKSSPEKKKSKPLIESTAHLPRGKAPKMPPSVTPPVLCVDCIFYVYAKRLPEGNPASKLAKPPGRPAALVRADEKKCGILGKYFKKVKDKWGKDRAAKLAAEHAARKEADKAAAKERKANPKGKKKSFKSFGKKTGKMGG